MIQPTSAYSILSLSGSVRANAPHATVAIADRGVYTPTVGFFVPRAKSRSVCNFMGSNPKGRDSSRHGSTYLNIIRGCVHNSTCLAGEGN
eukprot:9155145-Pyramimonas_sp.AAC.1